MRISGSSEDSLVAGFITAARIYCENAQHRAYVSQTWDLYLDDWPRGPIVIPLPPLQSVTSITSYLTGGTAATVATTVYQVDSASEPGRIDLAYGQGWPGDSLRQLNGFVVRFVAGGTVADVAETHKLAIKELAAHYYEHREAVADGQEVMREIPLGLQSLLWQDKQVKL